MALKNDKPGTSYRDQLAEERTELADNRTLLSYIRTSLNFLVAGISLAELATKPLLIAFGKTLVPIGIAIAAWGIFQRFRKRSYLKQPPKSS